MDNYGSACENMYQCPQTSSTALRNVRGKVTDVSQAS
jgi:hypothetical protein